MTTNNKDNEKISFSFGRNWQNLLKTVDENDFTRSLEDLNRWFDGLFDLRGKKIIDIGSGSGMHSLMLFSMQPSQLLSFDYDKNSVAATTSLWEKAGKPANWIVEWGSVLDKTYMSKFDKYDLVYSWGVLHHTGSMWEAITNAVSLVKPGGLFMTAHYLDEKNYDRDLDLKKRYNRAGVIGKRWMEWSLYIWPLMKDRIKKGKNPFMWNEKKIRGMNVYNDIVDWLGGLPYEVTSEEKLIAFLHDQGFTLVKKDSVPDFGTYLFKKAL
jgi:SAM-dependent methyltransferase